MSCRGVLVLLFLVIFFINCSDDVSEDGNNVFVTEFDGQLFSLQEGLIVDYGKAKPAGGIGTQNTHYNYDFVLVDGKFEAFTIGEVEFHQIDFNNLKLGLVMELHSPDTTTFISGKYEFYNKDTTLVSDIADKLMFFNVFAIVDLDGNRVIGEDEQDGFEAIGGTVTVEGSETNYTLSYDLMFEEGRALKGTFSGRFLYNDER